MGARPGRTSGALRAARLNGPRPRGTRTSGWCQSADGRVTVEGVVAPLVPHLDGLQCFLLDRRPSLRVQPQVQTMMWRWRHRRSRTADPTSKTPSTRGCPSLHEMSTKPGSATEPRLATDLTHGQPPGHSAIAIRDAQAPTRQPAQCSGSINPTSRASRDHRACPTGVDGSVISGAGVGPICGADHGGEPVILGGEVCRRSSRDALRRRRQSRSAAQLIDPMLRP